LLFHQAAQCIDGAPGAAISNYPWFEELQTAASTT
jgi:hypothetical protein